MRTLVEPSKIYLDPRKKKWLQHRTGKDLGKWKDKENSSTALPPVRDLEKFVQQARQYIYLPSYVRWTNPKPSRSGSCEENHFCLSLTKKLNKTIKFNRDCHEDVGRVGSENSTNCERRGFPYVGKYYCWPQKNALHWPRGTCKIRNAYSELNIKDNYEHILWLLKCSISSLVNR